MKDAESFLKFKTSNRKKQIVNKGLAKAIALNDREIPTILDWLNKIALCKCSNIPEGMFLREWWVFLIIWKIFYLILFIAYEADVNQFPTFINIVSLTIGVITIIMIVRLFMYIRKLRDMNCDCGLSPEQNIIYYYLLVLFGVLVFVILGIILMFMFKIE
jgi:hypothetical protein